MCIRDRAGTNYYIRFSRKAVLLWNRTMAYPDLNPTRCQLERPTSCVTACTETYTNLYLLKHLGNNVSISETPYKNYD